MKKVANFRKKHWKITPDKTKNSYNSENTKKSFVDYYSYENVNKLPLNQTDLKIEFDHVTDQPCIIYHIPEIKLNENINQSIKNNVATMLPRNKYTMGNEALDNNFCTPKFLTKCDV